MEYKNTLINKEQELLEKKEKLSFDMAIREMKLSKIEKRIVSIDKALEKIENDRENFKQFKKEEITKYIKNMLQVIGTGSIIDIPAHMIDKKLISDNMIKGIDFSVLLLLTVGCGTLTCDVINELVGFKQEKTEVINTKISKKLLEQKKELLVSYERIEETIKIIKVKYYQTIAELDEIYDDMKNYELSDKKILKKTAPNKQK